MDTVIDTGRLLLRRFTTDDLEAFYQLGSRPEIIRYAQAEPLASFSRISLLTDRRLTFLSSTKL